LSAFAQPGQGSLDRIRVREAAIFPETGSSMNATAPVTTVIVSPRDRYTGVDRCIEQLYRRTPQPFALWVLDIGYPRDVIARLRKVIADKPDARIIDLGLCVPMEALGRVRDELVTPTVTLLDNDTMVSDGWLPPLLAALGGDVVGATPLILERLGLDDGAPLRNHLYNGEMRMVDVGDKTYVIEKKHYRRAVPADIPKQRAETHTFELHCMLFDTPMFKQLELPRIVLGEHLDISLQIYAKGKRMLVEPASVVTFDNLNTRMSIADLRFFWYRWSGKLGRHAADMFARRWGYRFYSQQSTYNWMFRRKVFALARKLGLPIRAANLATRVAKRLFCTDWDPLPDADAASRPPRGDELKRQLDHELG
jgi:hypothetical protein